MLPNISKVHVKNELIYVLLLIPFFKPVGLASISMYNTVFHIWKLLSICVVIFVAFKNINCFYLTKNQNGIVGYIIFGLIYLINCCRFNSPYSDVLNNLVTNAVLIVWTWFILQKGSKHIKAFLSALDHLFSFWIWMHLLSIIIVRSGCHLFGRIDGDYVYLFGTDNYSAFAVLPMLIIVCYVGTLKTTGEHIRTKDIIMCVFAAAEYIYMQSISAAIASIVLLVLLFIRRYKTIILRYFTIERTMAILLILLFLIMRFNIQNYFLGFIADVLGKGQKASTLNSRTIIWADAFSLIMDQPVLGYGSFSAQQIDDYILYGAGHTHNLFLELLIRTGIVGTIAYLYFLLTPLWGNRKKIALEAESNVLVIGLIVLLVLSFFDTYPLMQYQYVLIALLYCCERIKEQAIL